MITEIVNQYPWEFDATIIKYSIGIHPWYIDENRLKNDLDIIDQKLSLKECLAIGECGLDKRVETSIEIQKEVFIRQIQLAEKHQKPIILHCVAAFQEVIQLKKDLKISVPMIIHGFSKNEQTAKQLIDNGFYISFGKYLMNNKDLETVFQSIPDDKFFLETDSSDYKIEEVYQMASKCKKEKIETIQNQVKTNFEVVFRNNIL